MSADQVEVSVGDTESLAQPLLVPVLFRGFNEQIAAAKHSAGLAELLVVCECERRSCVKRFRISRDAYERVRQSPTRFIVAPGHSAGSAMRPLEECESFAVVELDGVDAATAIPLDDRQSPADRSM